MTARDTSTEEAPGATGAWFWRRWHLVAVVVAAVVLGLVSFGIGRITTPDAQVGGGTDIGSVDQLLTEAVALHSGGLVDEASTRYEQILVIEPNNSFALYNLGQIAQLRGALPDAIGYYDRALAVDPGFMSAEFNRAVALRDLRRTDEAIAAFEAILVVDPDGVGALFSLGHLYIAEGDAIRGVPLVNRALELDPSLRGD